MKGAAKVITPPKQARSETYANEDRRGRLKRCIDR